MADGTSRKDDAGERIDEGRDGANGLSKAQGLRFGPLGANTVHLCVDMQRLFAEQTEWFAPWVRRVLPNVRRIAEAHPERTIFTRFIPIGHAGEGTGRWRDYYERWAGMTLAELEPGLTDLMPELQNLVPPGTLLDKLVYSPWYETDLHEQLKARGADTVIVTGGETDVCVLATVLGAVDRGYRIVVAVDALCSSSDQAHDALIDVYHQRYNMQIEAVTTDEIVESWKI